MRHPRCQERYKARRNGLDSWILLGKTLGVECFRPTRCALRKEEAEGASARFDCFPPPLGELRHLLGFYAPIHFGPIEIHASGHIPTHLVATIPSKAMSARRQRPLP